MSERHLCLDSEVSIFATCQKYLARARKLAPKVQRHHKSYGKREKGKFQFFCENIGETHCKDFDTCQKFGNKSTVKVISIIIINIISRLSMNLYEILLS